MKKIILFIVLLPCLVTYIFGQNWNLISAENKLNFLEDGQNVIQHTIWIDSISINNTEMI